MLVSQVLARLVAIAYCLLQVPSIATVYSAFQFDKGFNGNGKTYTDHPKDGGFMSAGVCAMGKTGGVVIFAWTLVSTVIVLYASFALPAKEYILLGVVVANSVLVAALMLVATVLNPALSVRSAPFYAIQAACAIILYAAHYVVRHESSQAEFNSNDNWAIAVGSIVAFLIVLTILFPVLRKLFKSNKLDSSFWAL